jgi:hypothetical protein
MLHSSLCASEMQAVFFSLLRSVPGLLHGPLPPLFHPPLEPPPSPPPACAAPPSPPCSCCLQAGHSTEPRGFPLPVRAVVAHSGAVVRAPHLLQQTVVRVSFKGNTMTDSCWVLPLGAAWWELPAK